MIILDFITYIKEASAIRLSKKQNMYAGNIAGYEFRWIMPQDAECFYMMMYMPQHISISQTEFLSRFLLKPSQENSFKREAMNDKYFRYMVFDFLTEHMNEPHLTFSHLTNNKKAPY